MDGAMIGGPVVTTANPGGSGTGPGWKLEAINTFPRGKRGQFLVLICKAERGQGAIFDFGCASSLWPELG
jgi:hypothetical protein